MADRPTFGRNRGIAPDKMIAKSGTIITAKHDASSLACVMSMAERELGAFISVVTELYGSEQARISAEDWLEEVNSMDPLRNFTAREWRMITIAAAARLASRLSEMGFLRTPEARAKNRPPLRQVTQQPSRPPDESEFEIPRRHQK